MSSAPARSRAHRPSQWGLVVALGPAAPLCAQLAWQPLGPAPINNVQYTGRISALACSPTDPDRYFAAGADGGVWRSLDGGQSWTALTDHLPTTAIGALAIDPANENIIYAGSGEANFANHSRYGLGLYKSTDGGDSWTTLAADVFAGRCFSRLIVVPSNPQRLYAAITRAGGFPELAAAKGHPNAAGPLGVFRSDDGGVSWTHLTTGLPALSATDLAIDPVNHNILYAAIGRIFGSTDNGIYKSTDAGQSWTKLTVGLPATTVGRISLAVAPDNPARIFALITNPASATGGDATIRGVFRSDDAGASWTDLGKPISQVTYGWYLSVISVQPGNPDTVIAGGLNLARSLDGGNNWSTITPPHVDMHAIAWDAAGRLLVGDDGGVHRSANLGLSWSALNVPLATIQFYAGLSFRPDLDGVVFGGTQDNGTSRRESDGSWTQILGNDGGWTLVDPSAPNRVFAETQGTGNLYLSVTGGDGFVDASSGIIGSDRNAFLPPYVFDPTSSDRMLYATHRVYQTLNGAASWTPISGDLTNGSGAIRAIAIAPSHPDTVAVATNDGNVQLSFDGGFTFQLVRQNHPGWPRVTREIAFDPTNAQRIYLAVAVFGAERVLRSEDAGQSWQAIGLDLPDLPVNVVAIDHRGALPTLYAGADGGVFRSVNDGQDWHAYGLGLPGAAVIDLRLDLERSMLVAGTQGRGAWRIPIALPADLNCDSRVDRFDIDAFRLALNDPDLWARTYPDCHLHAVADLDGDGDITQADVDVFLDLLAQAALP